MRSLLLFAILSPLFLTTTFSQNIVYSEDFESGANGWTTGGTNSSWELGQPAGSFVMGPPPETPSSTNSWITNLNADYNNNEDSWIESPVLDFSGTNSLNFHAAIWIHSEILSDGMALESSIDGGVSWQKVGAQFSGTNWYTHAVGWTGFTGNWVQATHDISHLAGEPSVILRFIFFSDGGATLSFFWGSI